MKSEPIHIVCTIDDTYVQHCAVLLKSLFVNNPNECFTIYIITDLKTNDLEALKDFITNSSHSYSIITINDNAIGSAPVTHHISLATYFRLFIPEVLPQNLTRVLFLDADMIVRSSIRSLWETDLEGYTHAATIAAGMDEYSTEIDLSADSLYFNAGMMLINLQAWRKLNVFERGCELILKQPDRLKWWDQDVLNIVLYNSWLPLNLTWNAQPFIYSNVLNQDYRYFQRYQHFDYLEAKTDPTIVHFVGGGSAKPWHYFCQHPFKEEYRQYLQTTPWKNAKLIGEPNLIMRIRSRFSLGSKIRTLFHLFA